VNEKIPAIDFTNPCAGPKIDYFTENVVIFSSLARGFLWEKGSRISHEYRETFHCSKWRRTERTREWKWGGCR
jgi:hypothetical protein